MSAEEHKAIVRRFFELCDARDLAAAWDLLAPGFVYHSASLPNGDRDAVRRIEEATRAALSDSRTILEDVIAEGDRVVVRYTALGTLRGEAAGARRGQRIRQTGIAIHRLEAGKIQEVWVEADRLGVREQLGASPSKN